jgi:hypothetical protein
MYGTSSDVSTPAGTTPLDISSMVIVGNRIWGNMGSNNARILPGVSCVPDTRVRSVAHATHRSKNLTSVHSSASLVANAATYSSDAYVDQHN